MRASSLATSLPRSCRSDLDDWLHDYRGVQVDNSHGDLLPLLEDFHNNLHSVDMDTGISNPLVDDRTISATDTATAYAERISEKCFEILRDLKVKKGLGPQIMTSSSPL